MPIRVHGTWLAAAVATLLAACGNNDSGTRIALPEVTASGATTIGEAAGTVSVTLTLTEGPAVTIHYATVDLTAIGGYDFEALDGSVTLSPAAPSATVTLTVQDDLLLEGDEELAITWSSGLPATLPAPVTITVVDDDVLVSLPDAGDWTAVGLLHPSGDCTACHRASAPGVAPAVMRSGASIPDPAGDDISPGSDWRHTLMAHALNDPYYLAKVRQETDTHPELAAFIEDKCLACHAPMARTLAHSDGRLATVDATCPYPEGCLRLDDALADGAAREGVSCTLCHGIDNRVLTETRDSGNYPVDPHGGTLFGPFTAPATTAMVNNLGITPAYGAHMSLSEHCRTCHDLHTPVIDADTNAPNGDTFAEQTPYAEWVNSDFARGEVLAAECQDCHMAAPDGYSTRIAVQPNGNVNPAWAERAPFARHTFTGGNAHMLRVLRDFRAELGIAGSTSVAGFDRMIAATREALATAAELSFVDSTLDGNELRADVRILNLSGHKLPTGYPSRRMWLALTVEDSGGHVLFSSGVPDSQGRLPLDDVLTSPTCTAIAAPILACLLQHVDEVSDEAQVPVYESVLMDTHGDITHVLLHAAEYAKDNRLPPQGFRETDPRFNPLTAVIGTGGDPDFNVDGSGSDTVHYRVDVTGGTPPFRVRATLYLQSIRPDFIAALDTDSTLARNFRVMMANAPPLPEVISTATADIAAP